MQAGISIVLRALEAPIRQIAENSGVEGSIVVGKVTENVSQTYGSKPGIFVNGENAIRPDAGPDGIFGTADDAGTAVEGFTREIVIKPPDGLAASEYDSLRQIDVTVYYSLGRSKGKVTLSAYIGNYRQVN